MSDLVDQNEALRKQVEELTAALANKDPDLSLLNAEVANGSRGGPDFAEVIELREVNAQLTKEVKSPHPAAPGRAQGSQCQHG